MLNLYFDIVKFDYFGYVIICEIYIVFFNDNSFKLDVLLFLVMIVIYVVIVFEIICSCFSLLF